MNTRGRRILEMVTQNYTGDNEIKKARKPKKGCTKTKTNKDINKNIHTEITENSHKENLVSTATIQSNIIHDVSNSTLIYSQSDMNTFSISSDLTHISDSDVSNCNINPEYLRNKNRKHSFLGVDQNMNTSIMNLRLESPSVTSNVIDSPSVTSASVLKIPVSAAYLNCPTESNQESFNFSHGSTCFISTDQDNLNLGQPIYITNSCIEEVISQTNFTTGLVTNLENIPSCEPIHITTTHLEESPKEIVQISDSVPQINNDCDSENLEVENLTCLSNVNSDELMSLGTVFTRQENAKSPAQRSGNEFEIDDASNDKDYLPSFHTSSSDNENDLLMENECLDVPHQVSSKPCLMGSMEEDENCCPQVMTPEKDLEDEPETNNENLDTVNELAQNIKLPEGKLKSKRIREKDFCFYCESFVLNFSRHMVRNHIAEPEVQLALSYPKSSRDRKKTFADLRKKGNYISNSQSTFKPVKKCRFSNKSDYLPCTKCLGFYSKKQLWKHVKKCDKTASTKNTQVNSQNFLLRNFKVDKDLHTKVFPRMHPDKVSFIAKSDKLICMFGAQYLRIHREEHFATVTSRKMRELAKLLIEVTKIVPEITNLQQVLKPQYYDVLVSATKIVARFNNITRRFGAPTYAMNIATSLKQCCSIALLHCCKMEANVNTATMQADLKTLSQLIGENWKFDISSQAADDLNMKKWNKITMVPLATDLKLFKDYLSKIAKQSSEILKNKTNMNITAFNNLVEVVFCRILLLNRRRPGELQRLKLSDYNEIEKDSTNYEEFENVLSATEKILVAALKRIVIRGKRGRGVPVLFSAEVQEDINLLLSVRQNYIPDDNNFLFSKAGGKVICGYKVLEKYAKVCGAKNYSALSSTRLRKHLATITQLLIMSDSDMEQLATFMGHTLSVHKDNYRLPNDVYQTAKISKLLLLMENGKADQYKGKALDEIDLNLDDEIKGDEIDNQEVVDFEIEEEISMIQNDNSNVLKELPSTSNVVNPLISASKSKSVNITKKKRVLVPWTTEQKEVVMKYFKNHIQNKKPPKQLECNELKDKHPTLLNNKDWLKIKVFIQNVYSKK